ncbi:BrnT family toxin [Paraburkholderia sediminicola]
MIDARLYCVVFTQRGETFRVISLRKANNREIDRHEKATKIDP